MKKQHGITLIALIITIIVLLILAGVSISLVVGQNGILEKSQEAVTETKKASIEEQIQLAWAACETEFIVNSKAQNRSKYFDISDLNQNLSQGEIIAVSTGVNAQEDNQLVYKLDDIYYQIQVTKSGEVNILGESSAKPEKLSLASQIGKSNYGDYVKYEVDLGITTAENNELSDNTVPKTDWRIFYEDEKNVYLIASDYLPASKFPSGVFGTDNDLYNGGWVKDSEDASKLTTSGTVTETLKNNFLFTKLSNVTRTNLSYQAVSTLLDTNKWSVFAKEGYVDNVETSVIGSPTVEMWMASWNERYKDTLSFNVNETGYQVGLKEDSLNLYISDSEMQQKEGWSNTLYYPHKDAAFGGWNGCYAYWLASPSSQSSEKILHIVENGYVSRGSYYNNLCGVRPVVALKSGIKATKVDDVWQLEL